MLHSRSSQKLLPGRDCK